jgi:hypothetical protein
MRNIHEKHTKIYGSRLEIKEFTKDLIIIAGHLKGVIYEY